MRKILFKIISIFICSLAAGQGLVPDFVRSYGGPEAEIPGSILLLPDSGYAVLGGTRSYGSGNTNIYLLRLNKNGDTLWTRVIGDGGEGGGKILLSSDQKLILENSQSMLQGNGANIMKVDLNGNLIWSRAYGGNGVDNLTDLKMTADKGFIGIGNSTDANAPLGDVFIMKTDSNGILQWGKHYGGTKWEYGVSILELPQGGYAAVASSASFNSLTNNPYDILFLKLDALGDTILTKQYSRAPNSTRPSQILHLNDGGFLISGATETQGTLGDIFLIRTNNIGDTLWTKRYLKQYDEIVAKVIQTSNKGFLVTSQTASKNTLDWDIYLIQTDSIGDTLWTKTIGGPEHDVPRDMIKIKGGYAVLGQSASFRSTNIYMDYDVMLTFIDTLGRGNCYFKAVADMTVSSSTFTIAKVTPTISAGCYQITNTPTVTSGGVLNGWCNLIITSVSKNEIDFTFSVSPNPIYNEAHIKLPLTLSFGKVVLYNSLGQKVWEDNVINSNSILFKKGELNSGVYFFQVYEGFTNLSSSKIVISDY